MLNINFNRSQIASSSFGEPPIFATSRRSSDPSFHILVGVVMSSVTPQKGKGQLDCRHPHFFARPPYEVHLGHDDSAKRDMRH